MGVSLYVHVPFCVVKCGYCDFNSYETPDRSVLDTYLDALSLELDMAAVPEHPPSIFIGGGTPTFLGEKQLERLFAILADHADLPACEEITIEANPESVTLAKAQIARAGGANRASIGAQSFSKQRLAFLDRAHSVERIAEAFAEMREGGFDNLNLDMIFGIPDQTTGDWEKELEQALSLRPDHLSCYSLTYEPGTRLTRDLNKGRVVPNSEDVDRAMFLHTRKRTSEAGFEAYEVSNFAGRGGPCRHNDHYWQQGDYVGVGPGAASHHQGVRTTNLKLLEPWMDALGQGQPATAETETLDPRQRAAEAIWLGLRRRDGVDMDRLDQFLGGPVRNWFAAELDQLAADELIGFAGPSLTLTERGLLFADLVGERILGAALG
ncbi:MAG: radical SAM family heme chaperone HemW [Planctomycetota bacterium]|nr:radical SAM family heme chaperone HemW [Planctomycetota bacterium]